MRREQAWSTYAAAQARVVAGLVAGYDPPLLGVALRGLAGRPRVEESSVGGVPATLFRPGRGSGPWPAVVLITGVTRRGRRHPAFQGIGRALATTGHLTAVVEPAGVSVGELTPTAVDQTLAATLAVAERADARAGEIALAGVSGGATLILLAAADSRLAGRVTAVAALAPCCDIEQGIRVATTGGYVDGGKRRLFSPGGLLKLVLARSVVAWLPEDADRASLRSHLLALDDDDQDPLSELRSWNREALGSSARAAVELLANDDPDRFDELYAALPEEQRRAVERLSPIRCAAEITAPVELVVGRTDKYIPLADAAAFAAQCPSARMTVIETLSHAVPRFAAAELRSLSQLDGVLVRLLSALRAR